MSDNWKTPVAGSPLIHLEDLPPELLDQTIADGGTDDGNWQDNLRRWADQELSLGKSNILDTAIPIFEKLMIDTALKHTHGRKRDAAVLLGWGRNTLTRKMNELGMNTTIIDSTES
jgi:two-component system nitrogen regulation response regulator GlnG